jgi:hypothetical protein
MPIFCFRHESCGRKIIHRIFFTYVANPFTSQCMTVIKVFQVFTAMSMKMAVFWVTVPCSLVEIDRRFRGAYSFHHRPHVVGSKHI